MKRILFILVFICECQPAHSQNIPSLPVIKPEEKKIEIRKQGPVTQPPTKVIFKSNDRDGDGLSDAVDRCPDQKGPVGNYGCPDEGTARNKTYGSGTVKDIDGNSYKTVSIGKQVWMQSNLNVSKFRNGDEIPQAKTEAEWVKAGDNKEPAWCYYDNDPGKGFTYGKLYNWYAVNDPRGLAPGGVITFLPMRNLKCSWTFWEAKL